ncbi:MAG: AMP-binding protein [Bdellovibrionota bacterium]
MENKEINQVANKEITNEKIANKEVANKGKKSKEIKNREIILERLKRLNEKRAKEVAIEEQELDVFYKKHVSFTNYFKEKIKEYRELNAVLDEYTNVSLTYEELENEISGVASCLQSLGVKKGDFVALFSESNGRWVVMDQALTRNGAISTLRGTAAPIEELEYILEHSECVGVILQNKALYDKLKDVLSKFDLKFIILMFDNANDNDNKILMSYNDVITKGKDCDFVAPIINTDDEYSMSYTSGTTGNPKGVLITHKNMLSQVYSLKDWIQVEPGEKSLEILPVWHAYERTIFYAWLLGGAHVHFTNLSNLKKDLVKYQVDLICSVPRIWENIRIGIFQKLKQSSKWRYYFFDIGVKLSIKYQIHRMYSERRLTNKSTKYKLRSRIYHKIARAFIKPFHMLARKYLYEDVRKDFGLNLRLSISGGGSLAIKDQFFYDAIGVNLREGYGLTETSPVITMRKITEPNYLGSAGKPLKGTKIKIVDLDTFEYIGMYKKGLVLIKGPQVMKEYYKNKEATDAVIKDGWFNTGDLGWITKDCNLVIIGREKETIVLSSGENVEPVPIEAACLESMYIDQIVLVGQDMSSIGALVVPSDEALEKCGLLVNEMKSSKNITIEDVKLRDLIKQEINTYIKKKANLKPFEKIRQFEILKQGFNVENGMLNQTSKLRRNVIFEKYSKLISNMFAKNKKKSKNKGND